MILIRISFNISFLLCPLSIVHCPLSIVHCPLSTIDVLFICCNARFFLKQYIPPIRYHNPDIVVKAKIVRKKPPTCSVMLGCHAPAFSFLCFSHSLYVYVSPSLFVSSLSLSRVILLSLSLS